jgi:hypothetical protein
MDSIFWKGSTHNRRNSRQSSWEVRRENAGGNRCSYSDIFFIVLAPQPKQLPQFAVTAVIANDKARHKMTPANSKESHIAGTFSHSLERTLRRVSRHKLKKS